MLALIKSPIFRYGAALVAVAISYIAVFFSGNERGLRICAEKQAEIAQEWAEEVSEDIAAAYQRGAQDALRAADRRDRIEDVEDAVSEDPAGDQVCSDTDIVDRLRDIRN